MSSYNMIPTMRWFGPSDPVSLADIRQSGCVGVVTALHEIPNGKVWPINEIRQRQALINASGMSWMVVESVPVHEDIKTQSPGFEILIDNYRQTLENLAACGIRTVTYNFMPLLDWTRTDLSYQMPDGSRALRFEKAAIALFDIYLLKRARAENDYSQAVLEKAARLHQKMDAAGLRDLEKNIFAGLPGSEEHFTAPEFNSLLKKYENTGPDQLRKHLVYFLRRIMDVAERNQINLAIHPDDPPFPIFGLPRVLSCAADLNYLIREVPGSANGLCFCSGSFGVRPDNDLPLMVKQFADRIHFIHLRNTRRNELGDFFEADHLDGDTDMFGVVKAITEIMNERQVSIPMRPDHGHQMLDDLGKKTNPGYSAIGRLRGLAELRGLELGISRSLKST